MAGFYVEPKRRPCYVEEKRAMFNCWSQESQIVEPSIHVGGHGGGVISGVLGIVEFEDGSVAKVYPERIQFADGGGFGDYMFFTKEQLSKIQEVKRNEQID